MNYEESEEFKDFVKKIKDFKTYCIPCYVIPKKNLTEENSNKVLLRRAKWYVASDIDILYKDNVPDSYFLVNRKHYPCKEFMIVDYIYPN